MKRLAIIEMAEGAVKWKGREMSTFNFKLVKFQLATALEEKRRNKYLQRPSMTLFRIAAGRKRTAAMPFDGMP